MPNNREKMLKENTDQTKDELINPRAEVPWSRPVAENISAPVSPRPDVSWSWSAHDGKQSKPAKAESIQE